MTQNQIFSPQRFGWLVKRDVRENWRKILLSLGGLLGALVLVGLFYAVTYCQGVEDFDAERLARVGRRMAQAEFVFFTVILFFTGAFVASTSFKSFSSAPSALSSLMIPASQFEKFLMRWLVAVPCLFIVFVAFAVLADWIRVSFVDIHYHVAVNTFDWNKFFFHSEEIAFKHFSLFGILIFFAVQSFFFLGSIVWPRVSYLKTFATMFALGLLYVWFAFWFGGLFDKPDVIYMYPEWLDNENVVSNLFIPGLLVIILFNYCLTFMRFRESETVVRW